MDGDVFWAQVRDLLVKGESHNLKVRENPKTGPFVDGLSTKKVEAFDAINQLMDDGNANRTTAKTNMNVSPRNKLFTSIKISVFKGLG